MSTTNVDVAVIGAGFSGMAAARHIKMNDPSANVVILEANDRVGGRILTDDEGTEIGGAFFGPGQERMLDLIDNKFKLPTYDVDTEGSAILHSKDGNRYIFDEPLPEFSFMVKLDVHGAMRKIDADIEKIRPDEPHLSGDFTKQLDEMKLDAYLRSLCWTELGYEFMYLNLRTLMTTEPHNISALAALWFLRMGGGITPVFEGESWKCKLGNSTIAKRLAESGVGVENIKLNSAVRTVAYDESAEDGSIELRGEGFSYRARQVIFAIPPMQIQRVVFDPPLPVHRAQQLQLYPMGHTIKTFTYYKKRFWREHPTEGCLNGRVFSNRAGVTVAADVFDDSNLFDETGEGCILGFIDADEGAKWSRVGPEERKSALAQQYAECFNMKEMLEPTRYKERAWAGEPWVGGCFFGVPRPGTLAAYGRSWREPMASNRIFFAGTEAANEWLGYMEGAVEAGERAARCVLVQRGKLSEDCFNTSSPMPVSGRPAPTKTFASPSLPSIELLVKIGSVLGAFGALALIGKVKGGCPFSPNLSK